MAMIKKIITIWQRRYQRFYTRGYWRIVFDVGAIILVFILLILLLLIKNSAISLDKRLWSSLRVPNRPTTHYKEMPLDWQIKFRPTVIGKTTNQLVADINYTNLANQPINIAYSCYYGSSQQRLPLKDIADTNFTWSDGQLTTELAAGQSGQLTVSWLWSAQPAASSKEIKIICRLQAGLASQTWVKPDQGFVFKKSGAVQATAGAYFYTNDGDQVGIGPLPPIVGLPTSYLISWSLENAGGDLTDMQFSAQLADNVAWQGEAGLTGGHLSYDAANRKVNWRMTEWPDKAPKKQVNFYISLNPTAEMVGHIMPLIKEGEWRVNDSWSEKVWRGRLPALSTNLDYDSRSKGQGEVQNWLE
ncbi:MAG TPA: hypothetical protein PLA53_02105 [bacterium]|nr:hypothetical protein [bacterium]